MATKGIDCVKRDVCLFYDGKFTLCVDCGHYLAEAHSTAPNSPRDAILQALARGYCAPKNSGKVLDSNLICAMADELAKLHPLA